MKVTRRKAGFATLQRVFQGKVSSGSSARPLRPIEIGDEVFGEVNGLTTYIHSEIGAIIAHQDLHGDDAPFWMETIRRILADCLMESAMSQHPTSMMCSRLEIREGYMLVAPNGAFCLTHVTPDDVDLHEFFQNLTDVFNNKVLFPDDTYGNTELRGQIVGRITDPLVKQVALLHRHITTSYKDSVNERSDTVSARFANDPHWKYVAHTFKIERMNGQYQLMAGILDAAIQFQGFDSEKASELTGSEEEISLMINSNWDIMVEL